MLVLYLMSEKSCTASISTFYLLSTITQLSNEHLKKDYQLEPSQKLFYGSFPLSLPPPPPLAISCKYAAFVCTSSYTAKLHDHKFFQIKTKGDLYSNSRFLSSYGCWNYSITAVAARVMLYTVRIH